MRPSFVLQFIFALALATALAPPSALATSHEESDEPAGELTAIEAGTGDAKLDQDLAELRESSEELYQGALMEGGMQMSLADAIARAIDNNLDVQIERHAPLIAFEDARIAWGAYDPLLSGDGGYNDVRAQASNPFDATNAFFLQSRGDGSLGVSGLVPFFGASYAITSDYGRTDGNSLFQSLSPEWTSGLTLEASVPLLKGLIWNEPWTRVKTSSALSKASDAIFVTRLMDTVTKTEIDYWDLVASGEQVEVAVKSLETASALLDQVETQHEVGVVSRVEVVEADAGVAERQVNLIVAENQYRRAQDVLINTVLGPHLTATSTLSIKPTDAPEDFVEHDVELEAAVKKAYQNRPELEVVKRDVETRELELRFAKNQRLPQLDFQVAYGVDGRRGLANPANPPADTGSGMKDTFADWFSSNGGRNYALRGIVSIPIPNTAGRHGVSRADLELDRAKTRLLRQRQNIVLEVRDAARNLKTAEKGIVASERRRAAAAEQLRAERIRLEHGESTPFDVLQRERDLVDAESQKIDALRLYRVNEANLLRAQGTILRERNVVVEAARMLR